MSDIDEAIIENATLTENAVIGEMKITEIDANANFLYDILHKFDDIYVGARVFIENNYFNFRETDDIHMVFPNLYISSYSPTTNLQLLQLLNINKIITALPYYNPPYPEAFEYVQIPLYDDQSENIQRYFKNVVNILAEGLMSGERILVHCMVGRSRSVTLVIAFLIWVIKGGMNLDSETFIWNNSKVSSEENIRAEADILNLAKRRVIDGVKTHSQSSTSTSTNVSGNAKDEYERFETNENSNARDELETKRNFINYKKVTMLDELLQIQNNYWEQMRKGDKADKSLIASNLVSLLVQYVRKYRQIACPNDNFVQQLVMYVIS